MDFLCKFVFILALIVPLGRAAAVDATVYYDSSTKEYRMEYKKDPDGAAWGSFDDSLTTMGWGQLNVFTNSKFDDSVQMHAAGYLEGALTHEKIWTHRENLFTWYYVHYLNASSFSQEVYDFLWANREYVYGQVDNNPTDEYWQAVGLVLDQYEGVAEGYGVYADPAHPINVTDFWVYESAGDLLDLTEAFPTKNGKLKSFWWENPEDPLDFTNKWAMRNRCSGLVKVLPETEDVYIAQVAWFMPGAMSRILKQYDFDLSNPAVKAKRETFSSYPGLIFSWDDFYVLDSGLALIETTFSVFNTTLYHDFIKTSTVFDWIRVKVSNLLADDGETWVNTFAKQNSGSYNNQWIVVDYNKINAGEKAGMDDGALWVLEQMPGFCFSHDITDFLREKTYMPSYNVPHFPESVAMCNYTETIAAGGPHTAFWMDPETCCRANIFRRDNVKIKDMDTMKYMMRYNNWEVDPLSVDPVYGPDAGAGIASRYDLRPKGYPRAMAFGALDAKITSKQMAKSGAFWAISGPTSVDQPVFSFDTLKYWCPHEGLPTTYDFDWVTFTPASRSD